MKNILMVVYVLIATHLFAWSDFGTAQTNGVEYALQQQWVEVAGNSGAKLLTRAIPVRFLGGIAYLSMCEQSVDGCPVSLDGIRQINQIAGSASELHIAWGNVKVEFWPEINTGNSYKGYDFLWGMTNIETLVLTDVQFVYPSDYYFTYPHKEQLFRSCNGLRRIVLGALPIVESKGVANETVMNILWSAEEVYYAKEYQTQWEALLKNIPCKCKYGAFSGDEWTGTGCVIPGSGNLKPEEPTVVTNYVFSTVTNHIYHHDVVTDMTAYHTTVTNVHVHYIKENEKPEYILPSSYDTGFVNVVAEVEGGFAVIPATWTVNYPGFTEKYGSDFSKALNKPNGKYDRHGNPMFVWQDYVAGTSPMDIDDVFDATIAIEGGQVVVSHTPVLDEERAALRKYTVYGKKNLMDSEWKEVEPGEELDYNFYRVTVRMK